MLPIIFAAILFGVALAKLPSEKAKPVNDVLDSVGSAMVVLAGFAMRFAPFAVPALIFDVTALFGWGIFEQLSWFVIVVILGYLLPLGATINMNGTSFFVTVVVVFLAQVFGISMSLPDQPMVVMFSVLASVGAAGVPSGSLPIIVVVLTHFGIPGEALALVLGVERVLDMGRTVVNVTGDVTAACYVSDSEGHSLKVQVSRRSASTTASAAS